MDEIRMGVIGIGGIGKAHLRYLMNGSVPGMRVSAVSTRSQENILWCKNELPSDVALFHDDTDLMDSGLCDAVLIAVPHYLHPELVMRALSKNLHVMCEKPAGVYTKHVREMNEAAAKSDKVFGIMLNQRTNCVYRKMHEMISSGELGKIKRVNWIITDWYRPQAYFDSSKWRATWSGEGGGVLINQCLHNLDLLQWICGMPERVQAFCHNGKWHDIEVEDDVTAYMEFPGGATGVFVTSTGDAPGTNRLEITLEWGKLICEDNKLILYKLNQNEREFCYKAEGSFDKMVSERFEIETDGENPQHAGVMRAFANNILHGTPLVAEGSEGIKSLEIANAMYLSSWYGKKIELPVDEELYLQELNKRSRSEN